MDDEEQLSNLFRAYRDACEPSEQSANFMPELWHRIESRKPFSSVFAFWATRVTAVCAGLCLVLVLLISTETSYLTPPDGTYADALAADHTAEKTDFAEAIHVAPDPDKLIPSR
jgi:hypothetical protein